MRSLSHFTAFAAFKWKNRTTALKKKVELLVLIFHGSLDIAGKKGKQSCSAILLSMCFYTLTYLHFTHTLRTCQSLTVNHGLARVPNAKTAVLIENPASL